MHYLFTAMDHIITPDLDQLLQRDDIWRGARTYDHEHPAEDTGHPLLNNFLVHRGWPKGCLIEINQLEMGQGEWLLLTPALRNQTQGLQILINPPAMPFAQGLLQAGLDLDRVLIIHAPAKNDFLAAFVEIARAEACNHLLAWQPQQALNYTEIRKCVLASNEGEGIYWLLRHSRNTSQQSPAHLRLRTRICTDHLDVVITKQKGCEQSLLNTSIKLPLPREWMGYQLHANLGITLDHHFNTSTQKTVAKSKKNY
ncbi:MAG TPA: translesion DNA synthesis-associated protein ImuA [Cellvibrio sp.]|nr:translesion DNA synthesis-associated protein ImuA [Cellvibrio sp.]